MLGPLNTFEIDQLFLDYTLKKKTKIKQKNDERYHFLGRFVKRYYKKITEKNQIQEKEITRLPKKVSRFRKGKYERNQNKHIEFYKPKHREERVFSLLTKPNLVFLTDMLPSNSDEEESCYSRLRAKTGNA